MLACLSLLGCLPSEAIEEGPDTGLSTGADSGTSEDTAVPTDPVDLIDGDALPAGTDPCRDPVKGTVLDVIDGDTIKVETGRGVERVRLIGIDTPEVDHSGPDDECYGEESKAFLGAMIKNRTVWLTFDSECIDDYGRTLAYVHRGFEDNEFIQRVLLKGGWASTFAVVPNVSFQSTFAADQAQAQSEGGGLWGDCR
jgi:endonuclease YncB( thermonuclease family)